MEQFHDVRLHDGVDESHFFGQLLSGERVLDGHVLLVIVEEGLGSGVGRLGEIVRVVADDQPAGSHVDVTASSCLALNVQSDDGAVDVRCVKGLGQGQQFVVGYVGYKLETNNK